jgi:hypothetical protein
MRKLTKVFLAGLVATAMTGLYSCSTEMNQELLSDDNMVTLVDKELKQVVIIEEVNEDIIEEIIDEVLFDLEQFDFKKSESTCPVITIETPEDARFPKIITRDFGDGCVNESGVEKSGKVIVTLLGPWLKEGSKRIVEFEDYTHRGTAVSGRKVIVCEGLNADSLFVHSIRGSIQLVRDDSLVVTRELNKSRTMLAGFGEPGVPNEWLLEGTTKVVRSDGREYLMNIRAPLHRIQGCRWAQSGVKVIRFNLEEEEGASANSEGEEAKYNHKVVIDYSYVGPEDSSCDSFVLRKVDDQEEEVVDLKR